MDSDHQNKSDDGVRGPGYGLESELVVSGRDEEGTIIKDTREAHDNAHAGAGVLYSPNYGLPERNSSVVSLHAGQVEAGRITQDHDSSTYLPNYHQYHLNNGIGGDASGKLIVGKEPNTSGVLNEEGLVPDRHIPKEARREPEQRSRKISIDDLLSGPGPLSSTLSSAAISIPTSSPSATPQDHPAPYQHYIPGSIHSPVPLPLRPRSSFGTTARPISNRRPGPIYTPRSRASPYLTSAARHEGVGLGINMLDSPSTPGGMHSHHSNSPLGIGPTQSPRSMSSRRRKAPEWPEPKSSRSHSFDQSTTSTPRDMYQTLNTPAALRVPNTAQLLSRPGDVHSPTLIPGSASGVGPIRRGIIPSSAPTLSARTDTRSPQIPSTPRRVHLLDVPRAKVISTLNERADKYWFDPSSSDCRIYVPIPPKKAGPLSPEGAGDWTAGTTSSWPPAPDCPKQIERTTGEERNVVNTRSHYKSRRGSQPDQEDLPVLVFHIHRDYIVTQSTLLRQLLTATSPSRTTFPQSPNTPQARSYPTPSLRLPRPKTLRGSRLLPQREGEPISIYMPIPDPASFGLVLHWLYWGDTPTIERALSQGLATWQGVVKNIEYLALDDSIKRVIGKWWRTWVKTDVGRRSEQVDRKRSVSDTEVSKRRGSSVESESTDEEREEDGMEVDLHDGVVVEEEDDGGVGDLLKNL